MQSSKYHMRIVATMMPLPFSSLHTSRKEVAGSSHQSFIYGPAISNFICTSASCFSSTDLLQIQLSLKCARASCGTLTLLLFWCRAVKACLAAFSLTAHLSVFTTAFSPVFFHLFRSQSPSGDACEKHFYSKILTSSYN